MGNKFFPFRVDPFSEGSRPLFRREVKAIAAVISPECVSIPLRMVSTAAEIVK